MNEGKRKWAALLVLLVVSASLSDAHAQQRSSRSRKPGASSAQRPVRGRNIRPRRGTRAPKETFRERRQREEEERRKDELRQWNRDLAHWRRVLRAEPDEEHKQRALFHLGRGYEATQKTSAAVASYQTLVTDFPDGSWYGEALVRLFDLKLERETDVAAAKQYGEKALAWAEGAVDDTVSTPLSPPLRRGEGIKIVTPAHIFEPRPTRHVAKAVYRRVQLLKWLQGDRKAAKEYYFKALLAAVPRPPRQSLHDKLFVRLEFLVNGSSTGIPPEAKQGDPQATALLLLANLFDSVADSDDPRAFELCDKVVAGRHFDPDTAQLSYARYLRGRQGNRREPKEAARMLADLLAAQRLAPEAVWAARALYEAGRLQSRVDKHDEALEIWQQVVDDYPDTSYAERSQYSIGFVNYRLGEYSAAQAAFRQYVERYPNSYSLKRTEAYLRTLARKLGEAAR